MCVCVCVCVCESLLILFVFKISNMKLVTAIISCYKKNKKEPEIMNSFG